MNHIAHSDLVQALTQVQGAISSLLHVCEQLRAEDPPGDREAVVRALRDLGAMSAELHTLSSW